MPGMTARLHAAGQLAEMLENKALIRHRLLEKPKHVLTRWKNDQAAGVASVGAMKLNVVALECVATWWVQCSDHPKAIPIDLMRAEAWRTRRRN